MTSVSMSDMMTKFKVSIQPYLDKGEEVLVVDGKSGDVRCRICPPLSNKERKVDWQAHWDKENRRSIKMNSDLADPVADALNSSRDESHLF